MPPSSSSAGVGALDRGNGMFAGEGACSSARENVGGLGGVAGRCCSVMCAFWGIVRGGGCGFCRGEGWFVFCEAGGGAASETEGRPSVICMTNPLLFPDGASISNSGNPEGGFVVYRVLPFRAGPFFLNDDMVGNICRDLSEVMML